jgi:uncharacterized membrane protein
MNVRKQILVSAGMIGAMLAAAGGAYRLAPAHLAVRWNIYGEPSGFADRGVALLLLPAIALALTAVFALVPAVAPARSRLDRSAVAWTAVWMVVILQLLFGQILLIAANLDTQLDVPRLCALCAAAVIFVVGNWMGKIRYNFVFGLRTPWTLADERVWDKTHRFAGRLMAPAAVVLAICGFALPAGRQSGLVFCAAMIIAAGGPALAAVIYSALIARRS